MDRDEITIPEPPRLRSRLRQDSFQGSEHGFEPDFGQDLDSGVHSMAPPEIQSSNLAEITGKVGEKNKALGMREMAWLQAA